MQLSNDQLAALNRVGRQFTDLGGQDFATFFQQQVLDPIEHAAAGILADARDINGVALPGVVLRRDTTVGPGTSLLFAWSAFRFHNGKALVLVAAGSLTLGASATNYVESDRAGTVTSNTTGFTSGRFPMFQVTTGAGSYSDGNVIGRATPYTLIGSNGIDGSEASTALATKEVTVTIGTITTAAGTTKFCARVPTTAGSGTLTKATFVTKDGLVASDTNYVDAGIVNKGAAGAGSTALVDRTAVANTTKATGGTALTAFVPRDLVIASGPVTGGDVLEITFTVTGTLPNALTECSLLLEFSFTN